ncbi:carbohydrate ABC transporter permease [Halomicrobium sp. LC1Hm]|uniref:carbohydrate ABC transporter permease n=1 Tax=Halomicrobium sp. LC1Hm TaxID=2610902 RepID=UPI0012982639|nr:carbohydrate ABC transporter permease [Halomicrobium sp. LC1Hm]QGA84462.1 ABC-type sugar transport system, permease component [Halomicrobium sp. LC1Hm]
MHEKLEKEALWQFGGYGFLIAVTMVMMFPIYWVVVASTLPQSAIFAGGAGELPRLIPGSNFLANAEALAARPEVDFYRSMLNSLVIAVVYTGLALLFCSMGGFALAKYDFKYKRALFMGILGTLLLPTNLLVIPLFLLVSNMGLSNSYWAVILPWAAYPLGIFFMKQAMQSIPDSLLEAARMDGASEFQLYYRVVLPSMKSSLAALAVILFLFQWNLFLWPLVVLREGKYTIPVAISKIMSNDMIAYDQLMVASAMAIVPMFVVFILLQRHFVNGILGGAVKE